MGFCLRCQGGDSELLPLLSGDWDKNERVCMCNGWGGRVDPSPSNPISPGAAGASPQREVPGPFLHVNRL